jgi:nitroreductase
MIDNKEMIIMSLTKIIKNRASNQKFNNQKLDNEFIIDLLNISAFAPNHKMRQNWRFIFLTDENKEKLKTSYLSQLPVDEYDSKKNLLEKAFVAPLIIYFIMNRNDSFDDDIEDLQAIAALTQNFLLLLEENNISSFWKTPKYIQSDKFKDALGLSTNEIISHFVMIGFSDEKNQPKPRIDVRTKTTHYK